MELCPSGVLHSSSLSSYAARALGVRAMTRHLDSPPLPGSPQSTTVASDVCDVDVELSVSCTVNPPKQLEVDALDDVNKDALLMTWKSTPCSLMRSTQRLQSYLMNSAWMKIEIAATSSISIRTNSSCREKMVESSL